MSLIRSRRIFFLASLLNFDRRLVEFVNYTFYSGPKKGDSRSFLVVSSRGLHLAFSDSIFNLASHISIGVITIETRHPSGSKRYFIDFPFRRFRNKVDVVVIFEFIKGSQRTLVSSITDNFLQFCKLDDASLLFPWGKIV